VQVLRPYGVGIDTHSKFIQVCVMYQCKGASGTVTIRQREKEFPTHWNSLVAAKRWVMGILGALAQGDTLRYCIESTGTYHLPVLKAWGGIPSVVNPLLAGASHRKTDVLDARTLAHHSITGLWKASFIPAEQAQVLRVIWARRREMARRATRAANQLNNIVLRFGYTFGADVPMRSIQGESILSDLVDGRSADVAGAPPDKLPVEVRPVVAALLSDLRSDLKEARAAVVASENYVKARDWPTGAGSLPGAQLLDILRTVPGVGATTALSWLAEITDPRRFANAKQVAAFCGCDPSLKVSAGKVTSYVRRQGNLRLHQSLLYAATGLLRRPEDPFGQWGRSIAGRHKKGGHKKACGAIARRLACGLWEVHRRGEAFSYEKYTLAQSLSCPLTPLGVILAPRAVKSLRDAGIRNSHQLARAYAEGKLAGIAGFGDGSIRLVKEWVGKYGKYGRETETTDHRPLTTDQGRKTTDYGERSGTSNIQHRTSNIQWGKGKDGERTECGGETTDHGPQTTDQQDFAGADAPEAARVKTYSLEPRLKFTKRESKRKVSSEQESESNQSDATGAHAASEAAGSPVRRRSRGGRPSGESSAAGANEGGHP
jgi:transposase